MTLIMAFVRIMIMSFRRLRKKSGCCVTLHHSSLRLTPKYASLLKIRAPCLRTFYEAVPFSSLSRLFTR